MRKSAFSFIGLNDNFIRFISVKSDNDLCNQTKGGTRLEALFLVFLQR